MGLKKNNKNQLGITSPILLILILLSSLAAAGAGVILVRQRYQKPKAGIPEGVYCMQEGNLLRLVNGSDLGNGLGTDIKADCVQQTCSTVGWSAEECGSQVCNGNTPGNINYKVLVGTTILPHSGGNNFLECRVESANACEVKQADWLVNGEYKCHVFSRSCPSPYTCGVTVPPVSPTATPKPMECKHTCNPVVGIVGDAQCASGLSCLQVDAQHKECISPGCGYNNQDLNCHCVSLGCKETCYPIQSQAEEGTCDAGLSCLQVDFAHKECINPSCDYNRQTDTCKCSIPPSPTTTSSPTRTLTPLPTITLTPSPTTTLTPSPTITLTPTPTTTTVPTPIGTYCICAQAKVYDENWNYLEDLRKIEAGKTYHFTVFGRASSSDLYPGRARFKINGAADNSWCLGTPRTVINNWCEVNGEGRHVGHTGNPEYFVDFKIPETGGTFTIQTEVYCPSGGWK